MENEDLEKIGLTRNESKIYLALLELGLASITDLIKKTKLHKQIIYDNLERLMEKGFVSYVIQANRRYFNAASPEKFIDFLEEQKNELNKKEEIAKKLLPELIALKEKEKEKQLASIYHGKKGIKSILESVLKQKGELLIYGAEGKFKEMFGSYWEQWNKKREKLRIKVKIIYNEKLKGKREKLKYVDIKYISKEFESPATTWIFDDKAAIILWDRIPFAILIESRGINKSYKNYFNMLWSVSRK
ncbi:MAG: helix-turn-helix domain-containing protein [Candidatus Altiarchaeota archaeon]